MTASTGLFVVQPLRPGSLRRARDAISSAASTAAIAEAAAAPAAGASSPGGGGAKSGAHLGLAVLARKPGGGDVRVQLLVRPNRLNARELHAALPRLPAADGADGGQPQQPQAGGGAGPARKPPMLALALKSLLEHLATYPDHGARRCQLITLAHDFGAPEPVLAKVLAACFQMGVTVHFVQLDEPGTGEGDGGADGSGWDGGAGSKAVGAGGSVNGGEGAEAGSGAAGGDGQEDSRDAADQRRPGSFAEFVAGAGGATFTRITADCAEASQLLASTWLRDLLAPPPLPLTLALPRAVCGAETIPLRALPRFLRLRPLLQPGMLCPCHGQPLQPPASAGSGGWPDLGAWCCGVSGGPPASGEAAVACGADGGLLQLGAETLLQAPPAAVAEAAPRFSRPLRPGEAATLRCEGLLPLEALDAQLLLGPALLVVADGDGPTSAPAVAAGALCEALRARRAALLCSCCADLDARWSVPLRRWVALQPGGRGGAMLLWQLAPREALLPPDDAACAAAAGDAADEEQAAAALADVGAALDQLEASAPARHLLPGAGLLAAMPAGVDAWVGGVLRASSASYVPPAAAPAAAAGAAAAAGPEAGQKQPQQEGARDAATGRAGEDDAGAAADGAGADSGAEAAGGGPVGRGGRGRRRLQQQGVARAGGAVGSGNAKGSLSLMRRRD
ncbi:hypothetical protein Rsub_06383 [Raphidocelis subcapitata]|uniref:Uncharacterized protein n=1 Tax=Raphidocelis subcapitata TaxID=307507 RepID=A0A2V0P8D3_9CHLO|nr:hypothetical protein Rsub_06383 [Raphidocelis subcapitata]|eukprot:GBF93345.1 hypothetical protein Rsub_06383 [Raphidocelis subcapitata]